MKILILAPYYFPNINPRAHRWTSIAEHWVQQGHEVHLITSKHKNFPRTHLHQGVQIHRHGFNSLKDVLYYFTDSNSKRGEVKQKHKNAGKKGALLQWINDKIFRKIYFPDDAFTWYFPARRAAKNLMQAKKFDLMISVSLPFTAHLIGLSLHKKLSQTPWIADTGDPFAFQPLHPLNNTFLFGRINEKLEKRVAQNADFITLTNEGAVNMYARLFPEQKHKFVCIPPLYKQTTSEKERRKKAGNTKDKIKGEKIKIGYFGSFFRKVREPRPMLAFWSNFLKVYPEFSGKLELHFYGNIFENFLKDFQAFPNLKESIFLKGMVGKKEVEEEMDRMDFLLNVGNATTFQLPSKSVDYLASGKPLINFVSVEADTFANFLENRTEIINIYLEEENGWLDKVKDFLESKRNVLRQCEMIEYSTGRVSFLYLSCLQERL